MHVILIYFHLNLVFWLYFRFQVDRTSSPFLELQPCLHHDISTIICSLLQFLPARLPCYQPFQVNRAHPFSEGNYILCHFVLGGTLLIRQGDAGGGQLIYLQCFLHFFSIKSATAYAKCLRLTPDGDLSLTTLPQTHLTDTLIIRHFFPQLTNVFTAPFIFVKGILFPFFQKNVLRASFGRKVSLCLETFLLGGDNPI